MNIGPAMCNGGALRQTERRAGQTSSAPWNVAFGPQLQKIVDGPNLDISRVDIYALIGEVWQFTFSTGLLITIE
ncbi:MAG: hypothetical protein AAFV80_06610 [Bacteroidota bacterium]